MTLAPEIVIAAFGALVTALGRAAWIIYRDLRRDRDYWRDAYFRAVGRTDRVLDAVVEHGDA